MSEAVSHARVALGQAERLMHSRNFASAVAILQGIVERESAFQAIFMLAASYLELGEHEEALRYASVAVEREPSSAPARDILARANAALGHYDSALSDYGTLTALRRKQRPKPPDEHSIPAHFALHNVEQIDHILNIGNSDKQAFAGVSTEERHTLLRELTELIDGANGKAPWVSVHGTSGQILADPPYVRVSEEKLPRYLNADVDYRQIQEAISTGRQKVQVIDDFLTPDALDQVQRFCLESTVWRHAYKFGYIGAFPQDGFASISLFAIAEELLTALGEALDGYYFAQWWGFAYDAKLPGTDIHADDAEFAVNLWITPDSANLDRSSGGLVVWDKTPPNDWTFDVYNSGGDRVKQFLRDQNAEASVVPYRENRAVLFGGYVFHRTDEFTFAPGFANRRRSLTFLFRRRKR